MYEIKKLNIISLAKITTFISVGGYLLWAVFAIPLILLSSGYSSSHFLDMDTSYFGILGVFIGLIGSAVVGFIGGLISAVIYNLVAAWIGGLKLEITLEPDEEEESDLQK
ncbi:MAG: hypothetical protein WCV50_03180 [Patescibacteria group bacterium]|jgi:hypothetical protein